MNHTIPAEISAALPLQRRQAMLLAAWSAVTAAGALPMRASAQGTAPAASAKGTLTVAAFPAMDAIVKNIIPVWNKRYPNVEIKVISRQFADHHTAMTTALSTKLLLPDVMALEIGFLGRFMLGGGLENLSVAPYSAAQYKDRFVSYAYAQTLGPGGVVMAMPSDVGPGTLLYRNDILEKAGLKEANLTTSWASFIEAGKTIKAKTGSFLLAHARDVKDILIRTAIPAGEGQYFNKSGKALINSPRFVRAFELAKQVRDAQLDAKVNAWSSEWTEGFKRGTLATQLTGAWLAGHLSNWLAPDTKGKWRAAVLPQGTQVAFGGSFYAIPKGAAAENKALAWELIKLLTLDAQAQLAAFKAQDAFPALLATHTDPFFDEPIAFLGDQKARTIWRDTTRKITAVSVHKHDAFAEEVVNTELDKVLVGGKDIASALQDAETLVARRALR